MGDVIRFNGITRLDSEPDPVLQEAIGELQGVVVLGYTKDGDEYFASSYASGSEVIWMMERAKKLLLDICVTSPPEPEL